MSYSLPSSQSADHVMSSRVSCQCSHAILILTCSFCEEKNRYIEDALYVKKKVPVVSQFPMLMVQSQTDVSDVTW